MNLMVQCGGGGGLGLGLNLGWGFGLGVGFRSNYLNMMVNGNYQDKTRQDTTRLAKPRLD